jgi:UDP-N-acetylglucosamine diphosphorylase / glucose-1-phosphate thymidylyltransferase / UDP-N-acetylgalactosamine diphosphorylase / glucosamine-1-phosphate N-acetyltransferase / galactosamine-1-phosphate N-acetyltransferase
MKRVTIKDSTIIPPFGEPARELRILNKPLWLLQRDILKTYCKGGIELDSIDQLDAAVPIDSEELLVVRDNLFFNEELIAAFISAARTFGRPCQIAFLATNRSQNQEGDAAIERHALQLQSGIVRRDNVAYHKDGDEYTGDVYVGHLYYYPSNQRGDPTPLVINTLANWMGYYHIPSYMVQKGDLTYWVPIRAFLSIENWIHVFFANTPFGVFSWGRKQEALMDGGRVRNFFRWTAEDWRSIRAKLKLSVGSFLEKLNPLEDHWRKDHFLSSRALVKVGKNCSIDPTAIIHGPTVIGDNVYIGPGTVIANSMIGNNVNIMQGCQVMLSVVSDRCFLPFNAGLFMTTLMDNSMVAQNSTLQLCVVGRNTFIGANNCFTDFNLQGEPIKVEHQGRLEEINMPVLGSAVGHNVKIGSGFVVYPGRMIGSNAVIIFKDEKHLIRKGVPGLSPDLVDEETGEPQRIVYHWPNVYDPARHQVVTPELEERTAPEASVKKNGHSAAHDDTHGEANEIAAMQLRVNDSSQVRVNATLGGIDL